MMNWMYEVCFFCQAQDIIDHLFISCPYAKYVLRVVRFTSNIQSHASVTNMFGIWLNGIEPINKARIRVGVCALVWAIWNFRNNVVFNKTSLSNGHQDSLPKWGA
jgi:hypothetical protein